MKIKILPISCALYCIPICVDQTDSIQDQEKKKIWVYDRLNLRPLICIWKKQMYIPHHLYIKTQKHL